MDFFFSYSIALLLAGVCAAVAFRAEASPSRTATRLILLPALLFAVISGVQVLRDDGGGAEGPLAPLRIASVLDRETTDALIEAFEAEGGIECEVDAFAGGTQTTLDLILEGRIHPDVLLGGTVELHQILADVEQLHPYSPLPDPDRDASYDDPEHLWTPLYLGYLAIVYRPLPSLATQAPDWSTLVEPRWAGRVSIPSPGASGGGFVFLATQLQRHGDEQIGWDYLELLRQRGVRWENRSSIPIGRVGAGTMDLAVAWAHDTLRRREEERLPLELVIPQQTGYEVGGVSILASSRRPEAAEQVVQFLIGARAGEIQVAHGRRVPLRHDVEPPEYLRRASPRVDSYDRSRVLSERERWLARWAEMSNGAR
jgi:iron(III) transport system substrate-binding protein